MITCQQMAENYGVTRWTLWNWCKQLGIKPYYQIREMGGMLATLDDQQEKQLQDWLKTRANEHQHKTFNK